MKNYDHKKIEGKWQKEWEKKKIYNAQNKLKGKKFYGLIEFPYPSGDGLHVGHPRPYIGMDIISRKRRMEGYNVLYPIGWDAFGLPTENYAIKTGIAPEKVTKKNSDNFRRQIKSLAVSFDWSREVNTTDPAYYKWTQWIFLQFFKKGLAYKTKTVINWCPKDKIGLANEEVINGCCERCGTLTEKREKEQWMLAITKYADRLDKDLDTVDYLPQVKTQQRNWIGKSEGSEIEFKITDSELGIKVFTTRADTIFGATYVILAPEHTLVESLKSKVKNWDEVEKYIALAKKKDELTRTAADKEKTGVELKGVEAINPANGEKVSVWVADYALVNYGTGAVMAVPAHDERDFAFATKYKLPIKQVIAPMFESGEGHPDKPVAGKPVIERDVAYAIIKHWSEDKYLALKWKQVDHWTSLVMGGIDTGEDAVSAMKREVSEETGFTDFKKAYDLQFEVHSKFYQHQKGENRYAKAQTIVIELGSGAQNNVDEEELKKHEPLWIEKNKMEDFLVHGNHKLSWNKYLGKIGAYTEGGVLINSGQFNGLSSQEVKKNITEFVGGKMVTKFKLRDWVFSRQRYWGEPIPLVNCEKCGWVPVPEKELPLKLPKVKSYQPTDTGESPLSAITSWVNTKCPKCKGKAKRETDTMPNWAGSSWYYLRYTDPKNKKEFASKKNLKYWTPVDWYNGGMEHTTLHLLYSRFWHKFLYDLKLVPTSEPYKKRTSHGLILAEGGEKMSKSRGNVVNPDDIVKTYGADTLRLYEMFLGPFDQAVVWSTESMIGSRRFIEKVWRLGEKVMSAKAKTSSKEIERLLHKAIKKVTEDIEIMGFNTAISSMMICVNEMEKAESLSVKDFKLFLQIVAPFIPHVAEELWREMGEKKSIHLSKWPKYDPKKIVDDTFTLVIQVNSKVRAEATVPVSLSEKEAEEIAKNHPMIQSWIAGKTIRKIIYVKNKLVNIVAA